MIVLLMDEIFAVYKPKGPTSHEIIREMRRITGIKKIGHAGTLDPLARGVLVIGVGRDATKKLREITAGKKEYIATIRFGVRSTTDDEEGKKEPVKDAEPPASEELEAVLRRFVGTTRQRPPLYSAVKIRGKEAYKYARKGREVEIPERAIEIKELELLRYVWPECAIRVVTGPGVYIRALARDIGEALGVGAYLTDLERVRVGSYRAADAQTVEHIREAWDKRT